MLAERIDRDLKEAMKAKETVRVSALRYLKAALANLAIAKRVEALEDADVLEVLAKLAKQHQESIEGFRKGGREELVAKEEKELEIITSYLPPPASREELLGWVREAVRETGAGGLKDMGKVMKAVMPRAKGRADGKAVNALVKEVLEGHSGP